MNWRAACISPDTSIRHALERIQQTALQLVLAVDDNRHLLGTVTDGDVRRALLRNVNLSDPIREIMERNFTWASQEESLDSILNIMREKKIHHVPILDAHGRIVDLKVYFHLSSPVDRNNSVLLMAGGTGKRLRPLTQNYPKPMLDVGGKPLLETIIRSFKEQGFHHFLISINYKAEIIQKYFEDGSKFGVNIEYIHETTSLGTAGALGLLPEQIQEPFFVMNCDLLTKVDFNKMLEFHTATRAPATMCVREYEFQVPYGVVDIDGHFIADMREKPVHQFFVNAGIYILEPEVLDFITPNNPIDMPDLFKKILHLAVPPAVFPIHEYWLDIGTPHEYERANGEFGELFSNSDVK